MKTWIITTCKQEWQQIAETPEDAVRLAFTRRPPHTIGQIVQIAEKGAIEIKDGDRIFIMLGQAAADISGFKGEYI